MRVIGTTNESLDRAEGELGRRLPPSYREWLLENNGRYLDAIRVFPVLDDRDVRTTWDSIVRNFKEGWSEWLSTLDTDGDEFAHLLPFAEFGTGDFYCFDYSVVRDDGEAPVVIWSHEDGLLEPRGDDFGEFVRRAAADEFDELCD